MSTGRERGALVESGRACEGGNRDTGNEAMGAARLPPHRLPLINAWAAAGVSLLKDDLALKLNQPWPADLCGDGSLVVGKIHVDVVVYVEDLGFEVEGEALG